MHEEWKRDRLLEVTLTLFAHILHLLTDDSVEMMKEDGRRELLLPAVKCFMIWALGFSCSPHAANSVHSNRPSFPTVALLFTEFNRVTASSKTASSKTAKRSAIKFSSLKVESMSKTLSLLLNRFVDDASMEGVLDWEYVQRRLVPEDAEMFGVSVFGFWYNSLDESGTKVRVDSRVSARGHDANVIRLKSMLQLARELSQSKVCECVGGC